MTEKQKYVGAFLDGYFSDKKMTEYGMKYHSLLEVAIKNAEINWKSNIGIFPNINIINEWLDKNGCPEIAKKVEEEALELFLQENKKLKEMLKTVSNALRMFNTKESNILAEEIESIIE